MRHRSALILLAVLVAALPAAAQQKPQTIDLQPHYTAGETARYSIWTQRDTTTTLRLDAHSRTLNTRLVVDGQMTWHVDRVRSDGSATCTMNIDWLKLTLTLPDGSTKVCDSRRSQGDVASMQAMVKAVTGAPITVEAAANGTMTRVSGTDAMRRAAGANAHVPTDRDFLETATDLATIPGAPAAAHVGDRWPMQFDWSHELGMLHYDTEYRLSRVEPIAGIPVATVDASSRLRLTPDLSNVPANGPKVDVRMTRGSAQGQVLFDLSRHEAVGRNSTLSLQAVMTVRVQNHTLTRTLDETTQSQVLRIAEQ